MASTNFALFSSIFLLQVLVSSAFLPPAAGTPTILLEQTPGKYNNEAELFSRALSSDQAPSYTGFLSSITASEEIIATSSGESAHGGWGYEEPSKPLVKTGGEYFILIYVVFSLLAGAKEFVVRFNKWNENRNTM
jgi:predicted PurR-regulated permease PerM